MPLFYDIGECMEIELQSNINNYGHSCCVGFDLLCFV